MSLLLRGCHWVCSPCPLGSSLQIFLLTFHIFYLLAFSRLLASSVCVSTRISPSCWGAHVGATSVVFSFSVFLRFQLDFFFPSFFNLLPFSSALVFCRWILRKEGAERSLVSVQGKLKASKTPTSRREIHVIIVQILILILISCLSIPVEFSKHPLLSEPHVSDLANSNSHVSDLF